MNEDQAEKRRFITLNVSETMYLRIIGISNAEGVHPSNCLIELLDLGLESKDTSGSLSKQDIGVMFDKVRLKARDINNLKRMAWDALRDEDDDMIETLRNVAVKHGFDFDDILNNIDGVVSQPIAYFNPLGPDAAMVWLTENMEPDKEYGSTDIQASANQAGFSTKVINTAKRKLNVKSTRKGNCWYWSRNQ